MSWSHHIKYVKQKINSACYALSQSKNKLPILARKNIYNSLVTSHLNFGATIYGSTKCKEFHNLETMQKKAIRHLTNQKYNAHTKPLFKSLNLLTLNAQIFLERVLFIHKYKHGKLPEAFKNLYTFYNDTNFNKIRSSNENFILPNSNNNLGCKYPHIEAIKDWNQLPANLKNIYKFSEFKTSVKSFLLDKYEMECNNHRCNTCNNYPSNI